MRDAYYTIIRGVPSRGDGGTVEARLTLSGEFDLSARDELRDALGDAAAGAGIDLIVVDLDAVTFIDSEAIGAMIDGLHTAHESGVRLGVVNAHGLVARVFDMLGLADVFDATSPRPAGA